MDKKQRVLALGTMISLGTFFFMWSLGITSPGLFLGNSITGNSVYEIPQSSNQFEKCLEQKNLKLYCSLNHRGCEIQQELLGDLFNKIDSIECSQSPNDCMGIVLFPTWSLDGERFMGAISLETLSRMSGCPI